MGGGPGGRSLYRRLAMDVRKATAIEACRIPLRSADDQSQSGVHWVAQWAPWGSRRCKQETFEGCLPSSRCCLKSSTSPHLCNSCFQTCNRVHYASLGVVINTGILTGCTQEDCLKNAWGVQFAYVKKLQMTGKKYSTEGPSQIIICSS